MGVSRSSAGVVVTAVAALLVLTGCGGTSHGGQPTASATSTVANDQLVKFAQCMRTHGVDVPDPQPGEGLRDLLEKADTSNKAKFQKAVTACKSDLPKGISTEKPDQDAMLNWARCMRDHGVDVPDPQPGQKPDLSHVDRNSPKFTSASTACQRYLVSKASGSPS